MPRSLASLLALGLACALGALAACSPALNWRQIDLPPSGLRALLPCKPDRASRDIALLGGTHTLHMAGCEADGALYAVSAVELDPAGARLAEAQAQWQAAMLGAMRAQPPATLPLPSDWHLPPAPAGAAPVRLAAQGQRPDGHAVQAQALWFAHGAWLFHAVVYAERLPPEASEPFFAGLAAP